MTNITKSLIISCSLTALGLGVIWYSISNAFVVAHTESERLHHAIGELESTMLEIRTVAGTSEEREETLRTTLHDLEEEIERSSKLSIELTNANETYRTELNTLRSRTYVPGQENAVVFALEVSAPLTQDAQIREFVIRDEPYDDNGQLESYRERGDGGKMLYTPSDDFVNFEIWFDGRPLNTGGAIAFESIVFRPTSLIIPAGNSGQLVVRADVAPDATLGRRHGFSLREIRTPGFSPDVSDVRSPFIVIGSNPVPTIRLTPVGKRRDQRKGIEPPLIVGDETSFDISVMNHPSGSKLAVFLQTQSGGDRKIIVANNMSANTNNIEFVVPNTACENEPHQTLCDDFPLLDYSGWVASVILYEGGDYCENGCLAGQDPPEPIAIHISDNEYEVRK